MVTVVPTIPDVVERLVIAGRAAPVPLSVTVCGLLLAVSVTVSVPG